MMMSDQATITDTPSKPGRGSGYSSATQIIAVCLVLVLALVLRLPYVTIAGHVDLTGYLIPWAIQTNESGLFSAYAANPTLNYPPVYPAVMTVLVAIWTKRGLSLEAQSGSALIGLFKVFSILADLGLILLVYYEFRQRRWLRVILPLLLAVHPVLIVVSSFWGQTEPIWTLAILLAAFCFRIDRPILAWVWLAIALLTKIQPVVAIPVFVVLTYRRYGLGTLTRGLALFATIVALVLAPFVIVGGFHNTMRSYLNAIDMFPQTTLNAYNLWYLLNPAAWLGHFPLNVPGQSDTIGVFATFTARNLGLVMLALWTLTILTNVWRKYQSPNEYLWLTCIYFGFFMLPTQIHERYLYPVLVTSVLALAQDARMWGVILPLLWSYTYNLVAFTHAPFSYLGNNLLFRLGDVGLQAALVQALAFISSGVMLLSDRSSHRARFVLIPLWVAMAAIIGFTTLERLFVDWVPMSAHRINALLDGTHPARRI